MASDYPCQREHTQRAATRTYAEQPDRFAGAVSTFAAELDRRAAGMTR